MIIYEPVTYPTADTSLILRFSCPEERDSFYRWMDSVGNRSFEAWFDLEYGLEDTVSDA